jgi:hypothetical protein
VSLVKRLSLMIRALNENRLLTVKQLNYEVERITGKKFDLYLATDEEFLQAYLQVVRNVEI